MCAHQKIKNISPIKRKQYNEYYPSEFFEWRNAEAKQDYSLVGNEIKLLNTSAHTNEIFIKDEQTNSIPTQNLDIFAPPGSIMVSNEQSRNDYSNTIKNTSFKNYMRSNFFL